MTRLLLVIMVAFSTALVFTTAGCAPIGQPQEAQEESEGGNGASEQEEGQDSEEGE